MQAMIGQIVSSIKRRSPYWVRAMYWHLPYYRRNIPRCLFLLKQLSRIVSPRYIPLLLTGMADWHRRSGRVRVKIHGYSKPLVLRGGTSDLAVFNQVFLDEQYGRLPVREPKVIVDAGANIGLTSLYFLRQYPQARLIALEPDPENYAVAEENLFPYRDRCTLILGALWSHRTCLALRRQDAHWATQVTEGEGSVEAYALSDLVRLYGLPSIDLLKMDIEGAEAEIFRNTSAPELDRVACCVIELHGEVCERIFRQVALHCGFLCYRQSELTVAARPHVPELTR